MEALVNPVRRYAWGSRSVLAALQGRPVPSPEPEAELWIGAHPSAPSLVRRGDTRRPLGDVIAEDPARVLGADVVARFGPRLPYLLKVLAADRPLSLQAHPDADRAQAQYAQGHPSYVDPFHKPEVLVALSPFRGLCGFRDPRESAALLAALAVPELAPLVARLRAGSAREAVETLLTWPAATRAALLDAVVAAVKEQPADAAHAAEYAMAVDLAHRHPGDVGVVVALLLHYVQLAPGEAIWMPAGNLHAYLDGVGVELMAASDNVLRGGLTPKQVDVPELLRVLRFTPLPDPVLRAVQVAPGVRCWPVPVADFALHEVVLDAVRPRVSLTLSGPRTVLCVAGAVAVDDGAGAVRLATGEAAFGAATGAPLRLSGAGTVYLATPNLSGAPGRRPL